MKAIYYISFIFLLFMISCGPTAKEKEEMRQQAIQDSIALVETSKPAILKILENIEKENPSIADFFVIPEIANSIKNKYGENYYSFLQQQTKSYNNTPSKIERRDNFYGEAEMYILSFKFETKYSGLIQFQYHINEDAVDVFTNLKAANDCYSLLNSDGTFALNEGSKWEGRYLEYDEFGDPDRTKPYVAVPSSSASTDAITGAGTLYIAVLKGNEKKIILYNDGVIGVTSLLDRAEVLSITIKNKNTGDIFNLSNYELTNGFDIILSEEDSQKIINLCNESGCNFSIKLRIRQYSSDWMDFGADDYETNIQNYENGVAYGLNNAIMAYFYRVF